MEFETPKQSHIIQPNIDPKMETENSQKAHFKSKKRVRVKEEKQAQQLGQTRNRILRRHSSTQKKQSQKRNRQRDTIQVKKELEKPMKSLGSTAPSSVNIRLDGMTVGRITALNTDASNIKYYTFFSRLIPQLRPRWEAEVQSAIGHKLALTSDSRATKDYVSIVEFYLDSKGHFRRALIRRVSGLPSLDEAGVNAFENAAPFFNPPEEMIEDDLVKLQFAFIVKGPAAWSERGRRVSR